MADISNNLQTALALARQGMAVFPCQSGGDKVKQPKPFLKWREASSVNESQIRKWWQKWPDAAIGLDLAKSGLVVVDADRHGTHDGVAAMGELMEANGYQPDGVPLVATPNEGTHFFYRQPAGKQYGNSRGILPEGVDIRGHGGYVIAPGTVMQDGRLYEVFGQVHEAPVLPDWIGQLIEAERQAEPPRPVTVERTRHEDIRIQSYCDEAISQESARVRTAPEGARNNTLNEASFSLGQLVGAGWVPRHEIEGLLTNAAIDAGLKQPEIRKTIRSGIEGGIRQPRCLSENTEISSGEAAAARRLIENHDGTLADEETGEIIEPSGATSCQGIALDYPPGLVGEIAQWIVAVSRKQQPELAIGAALAIVGAACGRQIKGPTQSSTALYVLALAPTGKGKEAPLKAIIRIMMAAGLGHHVGPDQWMSMSALINMVTRKPLACCAQDEFGGFMQRVFHRRASTHERAIPQILRSLWGVNFGPWTTPQWADGTSHIVDAPHLTLFGASTHEQFYSAMEGAAISDGTLNRFLVIEGRKQPVEQASPGDAEQVPKSIVDGLRQIYLLSGEMPAAQRNSIECNLAAVGGARQVGWCPDGSEQAYREFQTAMESQADRDAQRAEFMVRAPEMAIRIATILAVGRGYDAVRIDDIRYGLTMVGNSVEYLVAGANEWMTENEQEANVKKVLRLIRESKRITHVQLMRRAYFLKARDLRDILAMLIESEMIRRIEVSTKGRKRPEYLSC